MRKQITSIAFGSVILVCLLAACGQQQTAADKAPATAAASEAGRSIPILYVKGSDDAGGRQAVELALAEANAKGWQLDGQPAQWSVREVAGDNEQALRSALAEYQPAAVIGYVLPDQTEILAQQGLPGINLIGRGSEADGIYLFHMQATARQQGGLIAHYLVVQQGLKKIAIVSFDAQTVLAQSLQQRLQQEGAQADMYILGKANQADVRQLVLQLAEAKPDLVFYSGDAKSAALLVRKLQQNRVLVPVMLTAAAQNRTFIQQAGHYATDTMAVRAGMPLSAMTGGEAFATAFEQRAGKDADPAAAYAYDAAWALVTAMKLADSRDPAVYLSKLKSLNMPDGLLSGALTFDDIGWRNEAVLTVYQVSEGVWKPADQIKANPNQAPAQP